MLLFQDMKEQFAVSYCVRRFGIDGDGVLFYLTLQDCRCANALIPTKCSR
ncbi:MAG TPA: hypothetical protein O0W88_03125 [Methanocorpusculum sp.]|nr:hypothetical protein [Methanocorpusculum sp.]